MSASVLARAYNDTPTGQSLLLPSATGSRSRPTSVQRPTLIQSMSSMKGERARAGAPSTTGMRISFATDTSFSDQQPRSRKSSRSSATSLNLRPVQASERPPKVRVRIPKATTATGMRRPSTSQDEFHNPRKAMEIARSYGIPKYFLRSNSQQILTDGRMRLFGDSIWKKERTSLDFDRQGIDSSDVINRLMESVNKAIETSQKSKSTTESVDTNVHLEVISLKSGLDESLPKERCSDSASIDTARTDAKTSSISCGLPKTMQAFEATVESSTDFPGKNLRPHTVDTGVSLTGYLPKVTFKETDVFIKRVENITPSSSLGNHSGTGNRLKHLALPFRGVTDLSMVSDKSKAVEDKYHNVLPRFYPVVSAHRNRQQQQAEGEKNALRNEKKGNQHRLVRFADGHTVRFANDAEKKDTNCLASVVVRRAPTQSVQRALDSHSCMLQIEKSRTKIKETIQASGAKEQHTVAFEKYDMENKNNDCEE